MQLIPNFATDEEYNSVVRSVCTDQFPWYYPQVGIWNEPDPHKACFGHTLLGKHTEDWSRVPVLRDIFDRWSSQCDYDVTELVRCRINLYTPGQVTRLHQDSTDDHTHSLLWYFSESDGGTIIDGTHLRHTPNTAVVFDSRLWHEPTPATAPARITVNWIFRTAA